MKRIFLVLTLFIFIFTGCGIRIFFMAEKTIKKARWIINFRIQLQPFFIIRNRFFVVSEVAVSRSPVHIGVGQCRIDLDGFVIIHESLFIAAQGIECIRTHLEYLKQKVKEQSG